MKTAYREPRTDAQRRARARWDRIQQERQRHQREDRYLLDPDFQEMFA